jgi:SAM-dependent methyltransferase
MPLASLPDRAAHGDGAAAPPPGVAERAGADEREAAFWDRFAQMVPDEALRVQGVPDGPDPALRMQLLAPLAGRRVLDVGCGLGQWAALMALHGAEVWAVDISPESCATARRCAALNGVADRVHVSVGSALELPFPDGSFDAVHGQNIIHHLDAAAFGAEVARVLRPGGLAVFSENSANNKLLMFARDYVCGHFGIPKWSSDDEYPLSRKFRRDFGAAFARMDVHYPEFLFAGLLNAKVFKYKNRAANAVLGGFDRFVAKRVRWAHPYSYRQLLACTR